MENICASPSWNAMSHVDDLRLRMPSRPPQPQSKTYNLRRTGVAAEDLGSSFVKTAKQTEIKPSLKEKKRAIRTPASDDSDELNLPSSSRASSRAGSVVDEDKQNIKDGYVDGKGVYHKFHPSLQGESDVLKRLKFNKVKSPRGDDTQAHDASSSRLPVLKEHTNADASSSPKTTLLPKPSQTNTRQEHNPVRTTRNRSTSPGRRRGQFTAQTRNDPPSEQTRPKPRPLRRKASTVQLVPEAFPGVSPPRSPVRRMTISGTPTRSFSDFSPIRVSDDDDPGKPCPATRLKAEVFPSLSPKVPSKFPELEPLGSQEHMTLKKSSGKRNVSEKIVTTKPPLAMSKIRKRDSESASSHRTTVSSGDSDGDDGDEQVDAPQVQPFPMSVQGLDGVRPSPPTDRAPRRNSAPKVQPFPMSTQVLDSIRSSPPTDKAPEKKNVPLAQPFPMSTQVLDSIKSSPPIAGQSDLKRSSSEIYDEPYPKRLKENEQEEEDADQEIDPGTLCPYCDASLPPQPTSRLNRLLASAAKKSCPEPRPGNRLGRTAPFTVYIMVCQRHRFESQMLPEAERKGWPKTIDWSELSKRVRKMKGALRTIIEDSSQVDSDLFGSEENRPRARCVFWREALEEVRSKGTRAVAGVRGQFASFEKIQPGYYGEMGSVIIHQTLYDLFPPASIDPDLVSPLTASEFLQRIMVPEIGVRLIMQDMNLDVSQMRDAVKILRESANYGVAMFPVDEGEEEGGDSDDAGLGAADMIVMKRAMKRRKQLDADERAEEAEYQRQTMEKAKEAEKQEPAKRVRKKKRKEPDVKTESPPQCSISRSKPRPFGKGTSTTSVPDVQIAIFVGDTDVEDAPKSSQDRPKPRRLTSRSGTFSQLANEKDVEPAAQHSESSRSKPRQLQSVTSRLTKTDSENTPILRPKPRCLASRNAIDLQNMDTDETPRKTVITARPSTVDINLCSSSESSADKDWDTGRMKRGQSRKKRWAKKTSGIDVTHDDDDVAHIILPSSSSRTPLATRSPTLSDSGDHTPKPRAKSKALTSEMDGYWKMPPLQMARERSCRSTAPPRPRKENHAWLLSDNSHSSMESNGSSL
ncbi:hypothetical protein H2248_010458 [Termitomyces sp. 'cryptogamus']|nr:hypothetical protein H2248_010458 [Termitomyces sp. 'cryptogamus']